MNILFLSSLYPPLGHSGHDERCQQSVRGFVQAGHKVQVLTSDHRLPPGGVNQPGVFREFRLHEDSAHADTLGEDYRATVAHEKHNASVLWDRIKRLDPDFVYVWNMRGLSKSLLFQVEQAGHSVVYDLHSTWISPEKFDQDPWFRYWARGGGFMDMFRKGDRKVLPTGQSSELDLSKSYVCSESLRDDLVQSGLSAASELPIVYPFVDESRLVPKEEYRSAGNRFMWAGRVNTHKAPEVALDAVRLLLDRGVEVTLDFFGLGRPTELKAMRGKIERMGLKDSVHMRGIRPGELPEHFGEYDGYLATSRETDPFPVTVMQAIFSKLPCVVSEAGGIFELLKSVDGLLHYPAGDAEKLANAIESFLQLEDGGASLVESCIFRLRESGSFESLLGHATSVISK